MASEDEILSEDIEEFDDSLGTREYLDPRAASLVRPSSGRDLQAVFQIPVKVSAILGQSRLTINELLKLHRGTIVELDRKVGEAVDVYVNERLVARGEVVLVDDNLGITLTEVVKSDRDKINK